MTGDTSYDMMDDEAFYTNLDSARTSISVSSPKESPNESPLEVPDSHMKMQTIKAPS